MEQLKKDSAFLKRLRDPNVPMTELVGERAMPLKMEGFVRVLWAGAIEEEMLLSGAFGEVEREHKR